jgi:hypothetical protein
MLIEYGQVLSPGNIGDMNYYGYRDDLLKIAQIDLTPETFYSRTPDGFDPYLNEDRILLHLLARYDKRFELYYRITNTYRFRIDRYSFSDKVYWSCVDDIVKLQLASEPFLTIISLWFRFLWENMSVGLRISESHPFIEQQTLALQGAHFWDLLSPRTCSSLGLLSATSGQDHQCIVFNSSVWLHALRRGYLKETPAILQDVMFGRDVPLEWLEAGLRSYSERLDQIVAHYVNLGSYDTISKH